jgi:hypothetical protein
LQRPTDAIGLTGYPASAWQSTKMRDLHLAASALPDSVLHLGDYRVEIIGR